MAQGHRSLDLNDLNNMFQRQVGCFDQAIFHFKPSNTIRRVRISGFKAEKHDLEFECHIYSLPL